MNDNRLHTRRYPRTMNEAFGPYAGTRYHAPPTKRESPLWWLAGIVLVAVLVVLVFSQA